MRQETIRAVDFWLGRPLCFLLTIPRKLGDLLRSRRESPPPRRILFVKWIEQGATVLAHGALQAAVRRVGRENVFFSVFEENRFVVDLLDVIPRENVLVLRHTNFVRFLLDAARSLLAARRLGIDATIDMELFARASAIFSYLTGARRRVGLHRFGGEGPYRGDLLTHRLQHNPHLHASQYYRSLVDALDEDPRDVPLGKRVVPLEPPPRFEPSAEERERVKALLAREGASGKPLVLLNPNAGDLVPLRRWPDERWVELAKRLLADLPGASIAITGAPAEAAAAEAVQRAIGSSRAVSLAGKTTLRELLVLYGLADVLVTNDSGPGQFSAMTDIRAIVLFGPETPAVFGPRGPGSEAVHAGLACSPCVNPHNHRFSPCGNAVCMKAIEVGEVAERVRRAVSANSAAGPAA